MIFAYTFFVNGIFIRSKTLSLEAISLPPRSGKPATGLFVALHGWGANADDVCSLATFLQLEDYQFIFPNAPFPHPQVPQGRQWYDLNDRDYEGLTESRQLLRDWLLNLEEETGIPLSKTVLAGFSQGGAMTLDVGLSLPLASLCSLSGYLHSQPQIQTATKPPVLLVHGTQDMVVPLQAAQKARDELDKLGLEVDYHELAMGHEIQPVVLDLLCDFIQR